MRLVDRDQAALLALVREFDSRGSWANVASIIGLRDARRNPALTPFRSWAHRIEVARWSLPIRGSLVYVPEVQLLHDGVQLLQYAAHRPQAAAPPIL
jgi:hypothetical protein